MKLNGGTLNCKDGRKPSVVADAVREIVNEHRPDFLALQEAGRYIAALDDLDRYRIVSASQACGTALLVRNGVDAIRPHVRTLSGRPWIFRGHFKQPRAIASAVLGVGEPWHRAAAFHGVANLDAGFGMTMRRNVYAADARELVAWANHRPGYPLGIYGDYNATVHDDRDHRPAWMADQMDATPHHLGHNDQAITRGCNLVTAPPIELGSGFDHPLFLFTVRKARS